MIFDKCLDQGGSDGVDGKDCKKYPSKRLMPNIFESRREEVFRRDGEAWRGCSA